MNTHKEQLQQKYIWVPFSLDYHGWIERLLITQWFITQNFQWRLDLCDRDSKEREMAHRRAKSRFFILNNFPGSATIQPKNPTTAYGIFLALV